MAVAVAPLNLWRRTALVAATTIMAVASTDVPAPAPASSVTVGITTSTTASTVSPHFVGVNTDWWLSNCGGEGSNWGANASIAVLDLANPRLNALARGLSGATWRIGGTHGDSVVYQVGNTSSAKSCAAKSPQWHHPPDCYPVCLTLDRFAQIANFAATAGLKLAFGLNMQGDVTNVIDFLEAVASRNLSVDTFELGNELGIKPILTNGKAIADAVGRLWPDVATRPLLAGPDDAGDGDDASRQEFATLVSSQTSLAAITFHAYAFHHGGGPTLNEDLLNAEKIDAAAEVYDAMVAVVRDHASQGYTPGVWMGEGNAAGYGGRRNTTNTFVNGLWYVNAMGHAATVGVGRFLRQTLVGGGYELVDGSTFLPNPDYWSAVLYHRLVGVAMLNTSLATNVPAAAGSGGRSDADGVHGDQPRDVDINNQHVGASGKTTATPADSVRVHAACAAPAVGDAGDVVLIAVSFAQASTTLKSGLVGVGASVWQLQPGDTTAPECRSSTAALLEEGGVWGNLTLGADDTLPPLPPVNTTWGAEGGSLALPPCSISFVVVHGAGAAACTATASTP